MNPAQVASVAAHHATTRQHAEIVGAARVAMPGGMMSDTMQDEPAVYAAHVPQGAIGDLMHTQPLPARPRAEARDWQRARDTVGVFENRPVPGVVSIMEAVQHSRKRQAVAEEVAAQARRAGLEDFLPD